MGVLFKLAYRNLWRNKRRTIITAFSISFALFIGLLMRSLQLGTYEKSFSETIKATTGHIELHGKGYWEDKTINRSLFLDSRIDSVLKHDSRISMLLPKVSSYLLASTGEVTKGVSITGVDPEKEQLFYDLKKNLIQGDYIENHDLGLLIAQGVARYFNITVGDTLVLFGSGFHGMTAVGKYHVKGILDLPNPILNKSVVYLNLPDCQYLFALGNGYTSLSVHLKEEDNQDYVLADISSQIDTAQVEVLPWQEMNKELIQAMRTDSIFGLIMIGIIYLVVGFGIFGTIFMMTLERKREFSILIAVGMKRARLGVMVFYESLMVGGIGILLGVLIALPFLLYLHINPIPMGEEYAEQIAQYNMEPLMHFYLHPDFILSQTLVVLAISFVASLVPLVSIYRLKFAYALRGK